MGLDTLKTKRLILRQWQPRDEASFVALCADREVMRYFPNEPDDQRSRDSCARMRAHIDTHGFGFWAAELRTTGECIGFIGLNHVPDSLPCSPNIEIGWRLHKQHWRQGLATEGAQACLEYGFHAREFPHIIAMTPRLNLPSQGVMQKLGMRDAQTDFGHPEIAPDHPLHWLVVYEITRDTWMASRSERADAARSSSMGLNGPQSSLTLPTWPANHTPAAISSINQLINGMPR